MTGFVKLVPVILAALLANRVENCWLKTNSECRSLCDGDLRKPESTYVEAVLLEGDVADFGCLVGLDHIKVSRDVQKCVRPISGGKKT